MKKNDPIAQAKHHANSLLILSYLDAFYRYVLLFCLMAAILLAFGAKQWLLAAVAVGIFVVYSLICNLYQHLVFQKIPDRGPYRLPCPKVKGESLVSALGAEEVCPGLYAAFPQKHGCFVRFQLRTLEQADAKELRDRQDACDRAVEERFCLSKEASMYRVSKMVFLNVVACDSCQKNVPGWVQREAFKQMHRGEAIVNAVYCAQQGELLFPLMEKGLKVSQAKKYRAALKILTEIV